MKTLHGDMRALLFRYTLLAVLLSGLAWQGVQAQSQDLFQTCRDIPAKSYNHYFCYFEKAGPNNWNEAARILKELADENPLAWLALAHIQAYGPVIDYSEAERLYLKAANELNATGDRHGEVLAYSNAYEMLYKQGRIPSEDSQRLIEKALAAVEGENGTLAQTRAWILQARSLIQEGGDQGRAYRLLKKAERRTFSPDQDDYRLQLQFLNFLGSALNGIGRFQEAQATYRRLGDLAQKFNNQYNLSTAKYNLAAALLSELEELPNEEGKTQVLQLAQEALPAVIQAKRTMLQIKVHVMIANLLTGSPQRRQEAIGHYRRAIELARIPDSSMWNVAQWGLAWNLIKDGRLDEARQIVQLVQAQLEKDEDLSNYAGRTRLLSSWALEDRESAIRTSRAVLAGVEGQRGRQADASSREGFFSAWTSYYYLFSGQLLRQQPLDRGSLQTAFQVIEQMRARVLLEALSAGKATGKPSPELERINDSITRINRQLRSGVSEQRGRDLRAELRRLELNETHLRSQSVVEQLENLQAKNFASLNQVEEALQADEAMLSFQVGLWEDLYGDFGGGSWLLVSTKQGTRTYRLNDDRRWLEKGLPLFLGLIGRRDGMESQSAAAIYDRILRQALEGLPNAVDKLIVVPDGALHHLPFSVLPLPQGGALAERYQVSIVPSATLWLEWKDLKPIQAQAPALALADPDLPPAPEAGPDEGNRHRDWTSEPLFPLPRARQEGSQLVERLGPGSRLVMGGQASEQFIKSTDLQRFAVLHFATHALVNDDFPDRSSVMLAAGSDQEDGMLQVREIADLDLVGRVIVLSACSSASGAVLSGEGVIGLARAFFRAGANSVVGSLWPLRDDDAEEFFDAFYSHLSQGYSIASALNAAQKDRIRQEKPAQAWAGLVVLGDGNYIPFPGGLPQASPLGSSLFALIAALATAVALGAYLVLRKKTNGGRLG